LESEQLPDIHNTTDTPLPTEPRLFRELLVRIEEREAVRFALLEVVYVDEAEILRINRNYLQHDYVTDIITFRYDEQGENRLAIEGTLYCCLPRILEQAIEFNTPVEEEILRVFVHGLLHLCGYDDQTDEERASMKRAEDNYLFDN